MFVVVKANISAGAVSVPALGSRFWILAKGIQVPDQADTTTSPFPGVTCTNWTVPPDAAELIIDISGAQGGQAGGGGGRMIGRFGAVPGQILRVCLGERGYLQGGTPAFGGGGAGSIGVGLGAPGGGGCSTVQNITTGEWLLVAGGGGATGNFGRVAGGGGYPNGGDGQDDAPNGGAGGKGGTQIAGGLGFYPSGTQKDGSSFQGGIAAAAGGAVTDNGGAGGGGGWFGGGTGYHWGGGGGGSSYISPNGILLHFENGVVVNAAGTITY